MNQYQEGLKKKMDTFVHLAYCLAKDFPRDELYGVTSQLRRAALSVILNYVEGYARRKPLVRLNFLETSYGSLQESKYLFQFSMDEKYISIESAKEAMILGNEIGAMLWKEIDNLSPIKN